MFFLLSLISLFIIKHSKQYVTLLTGEQYPITYYINDLLLVGVSGSGYSFDANGGSKTELSSSFVQYDSTACIQYNGGYWYTSYQKYLYRGETKYNTCLAFATMRTLSLKYSIRCMFKILKFLNYII